MRSAGETPETRTRPAKARTIQCGLRGGDPFPEQQGAEQHHVERLRVVDDGGDGDRGVLVRLEEQDPVEDDEHPAERGESEGAPGEAVAAEVAAGQGVAAEGEGSEHDAEEDDVQGRGAGLDDEDAEGAGEHHRGGELGGALVLGRADGGG